MMETISETEFASTIINTQIPSNYFVDISDQIEKKFEIFEYFKTEIQLHLFPRSGENIECLAKLRGTMAGCDFAESFMLLKEII